MLGELDLSRAEAHLTINVTVRSPPLDVEVITLGCRLNANESAAIKRLAQDAALSNAVIVNTCAVTGEAVRQARQAIRRARRERPGAEIIVTGCAAQIDPHGFAGMPEVSRVLGNAEKIRSEAFREGARVAVSDIMAIREMAPHLAEGHHERTRVYVQVQNGCDHRCTFCIIPFGRGNARSAPAGDVVDQVKRLASDGVAEIVLTGVDLTSWGADLPGAPKLGSLVARILRYAPNLPMLRLSSLDAIEIDEQLFELVTQHDRVAPHLHLSLQHGDDLILKRMKRRHSRKQAVELCRRLKQARPEIALGADLIAGFPTETEHNFESQLTLVDECALSYVHVFPFSARPGAPAARMPQVDRRTVRERAARLRQVASVALNRHLDQWVGKTTTALVERAGAARLPDFTPVRCGSSIEGHARMRIESHDGQTLLGVLA